MAEITNMMLTWLDWAKRQTDGKIALIVEMMSKVNEIMLDMIMIPGNTEVGHKTTIRTGLPTVAWRQINEGIQPSKSTTKQITFTAGLLEGRGQVDEQLVKMASDGKAFRLSENAPFLEALAQEIASTIFYGNVNVNPERFTGLSPYYSALSGVDSSANVIDAGGKTAFGQTSLWLIGWGENAIHGFFPKNTQAGIEHNDKGVEPVSDDKGGKFYALVDQYITQAGLAVRDFRFAVRICNIDVAALNSAGDESDTSANIIKHMIQAINKLPNTQNVKLAWYCNRTVKTGLDIKAINKANVNLTVETLANGAPVTKMMGYPVRRCDAILDTEAVVI
ncbi:conserved hypothetical protein [Gammaproteobacteria bacterium]